MSTQDPVAIIGAGLAGLTAAHYLRAHGIKVRVFEASKNIAGLCRSEFDEDGFTYDCGAHFINSRLAAAIGVSATCLPMPHYEEAFWVRGKRYSYPFGLLMSPRFLLGGVSAKVLGLLKADGCDLSSFFRGTLGRPLADDVALPLVEAWSGAAATELSPAVADKFSTGLLRTMMLRGAAYASGKCVSIGYSHEVSESPHVYFVYPQGGVGGVCEHLADGVRDTIETESPVDSILIENERAVGVVVRGERVAASGVVNTAPLPILARLTADSDKLKACAQFRYRPMVFVNLKFEERRLMRDVVTWTPERKFPFFRVSDIGRALPWLVPEGKNQVTCDIGCDFGDAIWKADDTELAKQCLAGLEEIVPGVRKRFVGVRTMRTPCAYPVYLSEYETARQQLEQGTGISGLISVGRNGEFKHILMEDVYWRTRKQCKRLMDELGSGSHEG